MNRWIWSLICAVLGAGVVVCGWLVPIHLRAVDVRVLELAGRQGPTLIAQGLALVNAGEPGPAQMVLQAAQAERVPDREKLASAVAALAGQHPGWQIWGGGDPRLERLFESEAGLSRSGPEPLTEFLIRQENRQVALGLLGASPLPGVQELLRCRTLTNTVMFSPTSSASGQAFDAALAVAGLLLEEGKLTAGLSNAVLVAAARANGGGDSQLLEQVLLDLMSLGQRFNWGQLAALVGRIDNAETLRRLSILVRQADGALPALFSAVELSGDPAGVARYLMNFSQTGMKDLGASLRFGAGGVDLLLQRNQRLCRSPLQEQAGALVPFKGLVAFALDSCLRAPTFALTVKWLLFLCGGFLLAAALHFARPTASALERPLQVRGFHVAREILFALGFLLVALLVSEPFLAQESQKVEFPFRLHLPTGGGTVPVGTTGVRPTIMNQLSLLTLLLFFVLQGLIYTACVVKLAEIRRQRVPPRMQLKLLENEEHLFDAGLYLGFFGTIVSLILVSLGVIQFSLMAAYSSTSFGILFVSFFKIFHLRPARRKLLLEAETAAIEPSARAAATTYAASS